MAEAPEDTRLRLQITVDRNVAERVTELAALMKRSQSWLAAELLAATLADRKKIVGWVSQRIAMALLSPLNSRVRKSGESVTIQSFVTPETAARIEMMAEEMHQPVSKTCGWLLENAVNDHGWIIKFVKSEVGGKLFGAISKVLDRWKKPEASTSATAE